MVGDHIFWLVFMAEIRSRHALLVRLPLFAPHITYLWLMFDIRLPSRDLIADSIEAVCNLVLPRSRLGPSYFALRTVQVTLVR